MIAVASASISSEWVDPGILLSKAVEVSVLFALMAVLCWP